MKSGPAPGIIGLPAPAGAGPDPMPGIAVRPPARLKRHSRLPAPTHTLDRHPGAIGPEVIVKIADRPRRVAGITRRHHRGGSRRSRDLCRRNSPRPANQSRADRSRKCQPCCCFHRTRQSSGPFDQFDQSGKRTFAMVCAGVAVASCPRLDRPATGPSRPWTPFGAVRVPRNAFATA